MENQAFLKQMESEFSVHEHDDCVELETWTEGGVNMIITLNIDKERPYHMQFKEYVEDFDVDDAVDLHREDERYRNAFTLRRSLEDFESYKKWLNKIVNEME